MTLDEILPLFPPLPADAQLPCPIVVLDTETTGLPIGMRNGNSRARVVEIGAVYLRADGTLASTFDLIVRPSVWPDDPGEALAVSGLTSEQIETEGVPTAEAHARLTEWWPSIRLDDSQRAFLPWVAFNSTFDDAMLAQSHLRPPCAYEARPSCIMLACQDPMGRKGLLERWPPRWGRPSEYKWPKATEAMAWLGIDRPHVHRALSDAVDEALIVCALARKGLTPWR